MGRGGKRKGAGRPRGQESTKAIRVPESEIENILSCIHHGFFRLPLYESRVAAGFPSPADNDIQEKLDLNELLIKHPAATFFVRVSGSSMIKAGIHHNDILIVDRSIEAIDGKIVIASLHGELTVKRLACRGRIKQLLAENDDYAPIDISQDADFRIWGVVTNVIHPL